MLIKYKSRLSETLSGVDICEVIKFTTILGERINAYESEQDDIIEESVFQGTIADAYAFIKLSEGGYIIKNKNNE